MRKFLAVVKHEYKKIVYKWTFLIGTFLFPLIAACFAVVPAVIFSLEGEPLRVVIVDRTGKIGPRIKANLTSEKLAAKSAQAASEAKIDLTGSQGDNMRQSAKSGKQSFVFVDYTSKAPSQEDVRRELTQMTLSKEIDAFLIVPEDAGGKYYFVSRKAGDFVASGILSDAVNDAARSERLASANISEDTLNQINKKVDLEERSIDEAGREKSSDMLLAASFVIGMMIYITLAIYGQVIMGAVVEEKETRIAEILFSSATPFELMLGKLVGVGLAGLTQLGIWIASLLALVAFIAVQADLSPLLADVPHITAGMVLLFLLYFLVGYFAYASIFALIGSVVTTVQEGGQFAFPPIMLMLIGFYFSFAVIRDPSSPLAVWVSISPFFAPITMPVRILAESPPAWQIILSLVVNGLVIAGLVWLAGRVYRTGMLMYGKRATIPEIFKWIRQS